MAFVGNLLWFVFGGGIVAWFLWLVAAVLFAITVIGLPFAKAAYRISVFAAFPFGRELIDGQLIGKERLMGTGLVNSCGAFWQDYGLRSAMPSPGLPAA